MKHSGSGDLLEEANNCLYSIGKHTIITLMLSGEEITTSQRETPLAGKAVNFGLSMILAEKGMKLTITHLFFFL